MPVLPIGPEPSDDPSAGVCTPWATSADIACPPADVDLEDLPDLDAWIAVASDHLYHLTNRRWPGTCTDAVRPCRPSRRCDQTCSCSGLSSFRLPGYPVVGITEVLLDGEVLPSSYYRLDDRRDLVFPRTPDVVPFGPLSRRSWPCCQNMNLAVTEERTWQVTYTYGDSPPAAGVIHAAQLGLQLALSCDAAAVEAGLCELPDETTQFTRAGLTVALSTPGSLFSSGFTGLKAVDGWLSALRYGDANRPGRVWRPGTKRSVRRPA